MFRCGILQNLERLMVVPQRFNFSTDYRDGLFRGD
jgi:hypothetical protein